MAGAGEKGAVIVSGATFGIGKDVADVLARRGWPVIAFGLERRQVSSVAEASIGDLQADADAEALPIHFTAADVSNPDDVAAVVDAAMARHGAIHAVVNNAAVGPLGTVMDTDPDLWDQVHAVNLKGPYLLSRAVIPHMRAAGGGRIVNVGSGAGWGKPNMAAYAASKGGLKALTTALALDHFKDGIAANLVVPGGGGIVTGMSVGRVGGDPADLDAGAVGNVAGRVTTGEDLANAVAFLISEAAAAISGTVIDVGCFAGQGSSTPLKGE